MITLLFIKGIGQTELIFSLKKSSLFRASNGLFFSNYSYNYIERKISIESIIIYQDPEK